MVKVSSHISENLLTQTFCKKKVFLCLIYCSTSLSTAMDMWGRKLLKKGHKAIKLLFAIKRKSARSLRRAIFANV